MLDAVPEILRVPLAPTATVQDLDDEVRRRRKVSVPLEFLVTDNDYTSVLDRLDKTRQMGSVKLSNGFLVAQEEGATTLQDFNDAAPVHEVSMAQRTRLDHLQVTCGTSSSAATVEYRFFVPEDEEEFTLKFTPGQTVLDAKEKIMAKFGLDEPDDVTLLFSGKTLRDAFVLDRLRIGTQAVVVHLKATGRLIIFTAMGRRQGRE
jgi:hypothetical protein